jgi:hypothetical protein
MRELQCFLVLLSMSSSALAAENWKTVTDPEEIKQITQLLESALVGKQFSDTDDDTHVRYGMRIGTRHHMNACTTNPQLSRATFQKRGVFAKIEYRIESPCTITGAYVRIEYHPWTEQQDDTLRQECDLEIIIAHSGSSVKVLRKGMSSGSGDGLKRMMRHVPGKMTGWINASLKQ